MPLQNDLNLPYGLIIQFGSILSIALASCVNLLNFSSNSTFLGGYSLSTDLSGLNMSNSELLSNYQYALYHPNFVLSIVVFGFVNLVICLTLYEDSKQIQPLVLP